MGKVNSHLVEMEEAKAKAMAMAMVMGRMGLMAMEIASNPLKIAVKREAKSNIQIIMKEISISKLQGIMFDGYL